MLSRRVALLAVSAIAFSTTGCGRLIQQTVLLNKMRAQYYDMRSAGAKAFSCSAQPNWPLFVSSATGAEPIPTLTDTPWHRYLQGVAIAFHVSLVGGTTVTWDEKVQPPADKLDPAKKLQSAFREMLEGFFSALRPNLTNTLLPSIPVSDIRDTPTGYALTEKDMQGRVSDVTLDKSMQVTHLSVHGPNLAVESDTKYIRTPKGLLLAEMDSSVQHPDGSTSSSVMKTTYTEVDGFEVPSTFEVDTEKTKIEMNFTGCKVER